MIKVNAQADDYRLLLSDLKEVKIVTLPRPYPSFLPYYFERNAAGKMDLWDIETLQISIGPGIPEGELGNSHSFAIESVRLE